jgi:hypothetical protein
MWTAPTQASCPPVQAVRKRAEAEQTTWALSVGTCLRKSSDRTAGRGRQILASRLRRTKDGGRRPITVTAGLSRPQGPPGLCDLLHRRGVTRAQAPRNPANTREPAPNEFRFLVFPGRSEGGAGGRRRTLLLPLTVTRIVGPWIDVLMIRDLADGLSHDRLRSATACHRTEASQRRETGSAALSGTIRLSRYHNSADHSGLRLTPSHKVDTGTEMADIVHARVQVQHVASPFTFSSSGLSACSIPGTWSNLPQIRSTP